MLCPCMAIPIEICQEICPVRARGAKTPRKKGEQTGSPPASLPILMGFHERIRGRHIIWNDGGVSEVSVDFAEFINTSFTV